MDGEILRPAAAARLMQVKLHVAACDIVGAMSEPVRHKSERLLEACKGLAPLPAAFAHPCDAASLQGAVDAARAGLVLPILVGPAARIRAAAAGASIDISGYAIVDTPHSHASAAEAVRLVRKGEAQLLVKGSLHTDEFMVAVVDAERGLRTARRISHCFVMDVPLLEDLVIITDAAVNVAPTLAEKADIVQNAIDFARALRFGEVRVAILAANENVNPKIASTVEAAALCKMADRGQIVGAILDGPLALDNAISLKAARIKLIDSAVAGRANVLVVPDLEAGNMLAKSLSFLAGADAAGVVLGAKVPIVLSSRADQPRSRLVSCAAALLLAHARRTDPGRAIT